MLAIAAGAPGCDAGGGAPDVEDLEVSGPDAAQDVAPTPDDGPAPDDIPEPVVEPVFELGTNVTGANTPDSFTALADGDELNIELGFQGLWMVVLAFRTRDIFDGDVTIITQIGVDDIVQGELGLAKQKLHPGGSGLDYYYNLFLVVMDPTVAGATGQITLEVYDAHDHRVEVTLEVALTGGAAP